MVQKFNARAKEDRTYVWAVFEKATGEVVGVLDISVLYRRNLQVANLGYRVFNHAWRQGYGSEFVRASIPRVLRDLRLNRLEAVIDPDNRASIALAKKSGMTREGIRRRYYYQNGEWADQVVFSAHRKEHGLPCLHPEK